MQKKRYVTSLLAMVWLIICSANVATADDKYCSISEIISTTPGYWEGVYSSKQGSEVSVNVPIVLPNVEKFPIVRVTWGGPYTTLKMPLLIRENTKRVVDFLHLLDENVGVGGSILEEHSSVIDDLPWEDASNAFITQIKACIPELEDREFQCSHMAAYQGIKNTRSCPGYRLTCYELYHGIPYVTSGNYANTVDSERGADSELPSIPGACVDGEILNQDKIFACVWTPKEVCVEIEDVPLLSFARIKEVLEQRVRDGYVYTLNEVRLGYMALIDPNHKGEEFLLYPVWVAKGRTRGDISVPFDLLSDQAVFDFTGYNSGSIIAIDAQTGEVFDFAHDIRPTRRYVPDMITWDEVE